MTQCVLLEVVGRALSFHQSLHADVFPKHRAFDALMNLKSEETLQVGFVVDPVRYGHAIDPRFDDISLGRNGQAVPLTLLCGRSTFFVLVRSSRFA